MRSEMFLLKDRKGVLYGKNNRIMPTDLSVTSVEYMFWCMGNAYATEPKAVNDREVVSVLV